MEQLIEGKAPNFLDPCTGATLHSSCTEVCPWSSGHRSHTQFSHYVKYSSFWAPRN